MTLAIPKKNVLMHSTSEANKRNLDFLETVQKTKQSYNIRKIPFSIFSAETGIHIRLSAKVGLVDW
jgi:hypothetical protein